ncbi:hypothetical protein O181_018230 [Austropuccinia psidii MF-1]|uniref:Uncharacterized protein n=1 Tax=Austropuccinia psidii MF-1 TaxID=1389203 RepID=A0A9Q3C9E9_9BASI|nr:hypothetical protein [Austropuccinia psidii MF-1]
MDDIEQLLHTLPRMSTPLNQNEGTRIPNPQVLEVEDSQLKKKFSTSFHNLEPSMGQALLKEVPVTTMKDDPPPLVLWQFQPGTKLGPIGHTISLWPILPLLVRYGILAISLLPGLLWPQAISCHHWPPWPIPLPLTPRPLSLFWAWGVSLSSRRFWVP